MTEKQRLKAKLIEELVEHGTLKCPLPLMPHAGYDIQTCCYRCGWIRTQCICKHNERLAIIEEVFGD